MQNFRRNQVLLTSLVGVLMLQTSCLQGPSLFKQSISPTSQDYEMVASQEGGVSSAVFDPRAGVTQVLSAAVGSVLAGTTLSFPPGSLSSATSISIQEGASIASSGTAATLNLGTSVSEAGPSVVISSALQIDADKPFTLTIPTTGSGLFLDAGNMVVLYKIYRASTDSYFYGVFTADQLTFKDGGVSFDTKWFGSYQAARTETKILKPVEVKSDTPVLTKSEETKLPDIVWALGVPSFVEQNRAVSVPIGVSGFSTLTKCAVFTHTSQNGPWINVDETKDPKVLNKVNSGQKDTYEYKVATDEAITLYFRFECFDIKGRQSMSPWTQALTVPKKPVTAPLPPKTDTSTSSSTSDSTALDAMTKFSSTINLYSSVGSNRLLGSNGLSERTLTGTCSPGEQLTIRAEEGVFPQGDASPGPVGGIQYITCSSAGSFAASVTANTPSSTCSSNFCLGNITRGFLFELIRDGHMVDRTVLYKTISPWNVTYIANSTQLSSLSSSANTMFILTGDIVFSSTRSSAILSSFEGILEGDFRKISGLSRNASFAPGALYDSGALFDSIISGGKIRRVEFLSPVLNLACSGPCSGSPRFGIIAGTVAAGAEVSQVKISNATISPLSGATYVPPANAIGGVVGQLNGKLGDVAVNNMMLSSLSGFSSLGGVVGNVAIGGEVFNVDANTTISSPSTSSNGYVGGIVGSLLGKIFASRVETFIDSVGQSTNSSCGSIAGRIGPDDNVRVNSVFVRNSYVGNCTHSSRVFGSADSPTSPGPQLGKIAYSSDEKNSGGGLDSITTHSVSACGYLVSDGSCALIDNQIFKDSNSVYYSGSYFDFNSFWAIDSSGYPVLRRVP